jgi:hypothetical protein
MTKERKKLPADPCLFSCQLRNQKLDTYLYFEIFTPIEIQALTRLWEVRYRIKMNDKKAKTLTVSGSSWLQALLLAIEGVRICIPSSQENDWVSSDGLPSWIVFPRHVPISWGYDTFNEIVRFADWRVQEVAEAAKRRQKL